MRVGIYGGTFNPPHVGHLKSAKTAADQLELDLLIVVPSGVPPHKQLPDNTPSADARLYMTSSAFSGLMNTVVIDIEIKNPGVSYCADTVNTIKDKYTGAELFLLLGTDMFLTLDLWMNCESLLSAVTPAVFSRSTEDSKKIANYSKALQEQYNVLARTVTNKVVEISSSQLREMLPNRMGAEYLSDQVYAYIIKNKLYGAKPCWNWLRTRAHSMLNPDRIPHVEGCEEEAVRLAERWSVDVDDAREAAILHDITKKLGAEDNLAILREHGVKINELVKGEEKLLHSKTAALLALTEFGVSEAVADAIEWHTTGKAGMTKLSKIIYLADYIEPKRDFEGVDVLRALSYENLDSAMKMGIEISIADMKSRGIVPNQATFDALNDLQIGGA